MKSSKEMKLVKLKDLVPYQNNARTHSDEQITKLRSSLREFGFVNPVLVDKDYNIIAGHGRVMAAKAEGIKEVPCVMVEHLTEAQKKAYILADNRLALDAGWDEDLLKIEFDALKDMDFDLSLTGFELDEINFEVEEEKEVQEDDFDVDEAMDEIEKPIAKRGDVWQLGRHRLMCGDSTVVDDVEKLMDGEKADMVFTDPPYNIDYKGIKDDRTIKNDKMSDEDFILFLESALIKCDTSYVCCSWQYSHLFKKAMEGVGIPPKAMIIWNKVNPAQNLDKYFKQHEIIFYHGKFGGEKTIRGDIWECKRQRNTVHPTMKPLELIEIALNDNKDKEIIYDGFGGSGSTLIACEQTNRICYMMELDEKYVDVIIKRWETLTGEKAELIK